MISWEYMVAYSLIGGMLALTAIGLRVAAIMPGTERWNRRFFMSLFATTMLLILSALIDTLVWDNPGMAAAERIAVYFEYLLISLIPPMFTAYLLRTCEGQGRPDASADTSKGPGSYIAGYTSFTPTREKWKRSTMFRTALILWSLFFILLGIAQCTTFLYYVTPDNQFCRGPWHPLLMVPLILIMLLNLAGVIRKRRSLPPKYFAAFLVHLIPLTATWTFHTFFYAPIIPFIGVVFSTLSMFAIILYDQMERYIRQQQEIAHQRASIMVLQMRPHFIYNAMMSIYYLCAQDPQKAQQVTLDFTAYLRKNFTAIASEDTVPFSDELEHTRAYLAVEQVQFEDELLVSFDTPHTAFQIPPLTLQPLVENAVKHGMDPESAPLHIAIRTRKTNAGSEIVVEDNGPGFVPSDEPHIALANILERLEMMCGGKLTIQPCDGGGTKVTVTIP